VAVALTLSLASLGSTGAFFSDTHQGNIDGTIGSIKITGSGGDGASNLDLHYSNLLPGVTQTVTAGYQNTGLNPEDVWVVFNNPDALHALNDLGGYGEFHVAANGTAVFDSTNLKDNGDGHNHCPVYVQANNGCWPLPQELKIASNVAPAATGTMSFGFAYGTKFKIQPAVGVNPWNPFPVGTLSVPNPVVTGYGLPYEIVATQVGQTPGS
jgi:hypothetical protein